MSGVTSDSKSKKAPAAQGSASAQNIDAPDNAYDKNQTSSKICGRVAVVVMGASGDLAKRKTFPALFKLLQNKLIPDDILLVGYSRTEMSPETFRSSIGKSMSHLRDEEWKPYMQNVHYFVGSYNDVADLEKMSTQIDEICQFQLNNRIFYMALPPDIFESTAKALAKVSSTKDGWVKIIVEKPFGRDYDTSCYINSQLSKYFMEEQIFRIDHYLGKEMVQNLMNLRFANSIFEPIWNNLHISNIQITFKENFGIEKRAGYFDRYGIIRDVMQNHLLQMMSLMAMEAPVSLEAEDIRNEKVKVLRFVEKLNVEDLIIGQYTASSEHCGYLDEDGVQPNSTTPTFASAVLHINNSRWRGVPFILKCGKGLDEQKTEVRVQFKNLTYLYRNTAQNELVFLIQPNQAVYLKMMTKAPGLTNELIRSEMDLTYKQKYGSTPIPDAYERLILDVIKNDRSLFVRADELEYSWKIFSPILHLLEQAKIKPLLYEFGSRGPKESDELFTKYGWINYNDNDSNISRFASVNKNF